MKNTKKMMLISNNNNNHNISKKNGNSEIINLIMQFFQILFKYFNIFFLYFQKSNKKKKFKFFKIYKFKNKINFLKCKYIFLHANKVLLIANFHLITNMLLCLNLKIFKFMKQKIYLLKLQFALIHYKAKEI